MDAAAGAGGSGATGGTSGAGGTGGSDGGVCGPAPGTGTICEQSCSKSAAVTDGLCDAVDPALCKLRCEKSLAQHPTCAKEALAVTECAAKTGCWSCPAFQLALSGCDPERKALLTCTTCLQTGNESLCSYCGKENCCAEGKAMVQAKDGLGFADCIEECSVSNCLAICKAAFPDAGKAADAFQACLATPCPAACGGSSSGTDVVREYCKAAIAACKLGLTQDNCELSMRQMSSISRCGESRWKQMECDLAKGIKCDSTGSPVMDPTCEAILDSCAFIACTSGGSGDGSCWAGCDDWGAKCEAGGKSCECTGGKNIGKKFTLSTPCDEQAMELTCSL